MQEYMKEGLAELLASYEAVFGKVSVFDNSGVQVYPTQIYSAPESYRITLDGRVVGQVRAQTEQAATLVGQAVAAHWRALHWQKQHIHGQARLIEEIKVRTELEEALKFMELKALQSQVNPHFLFNTLTTIAGLAMFEGAEETTQLLQALSRLLRYSLRRIGNSVSMSEELSNIKDYLSIQRVRFGERIGITLEIDDDAMNAQIPVLTLQPLVENSIIHGLESREEGHLTVRVRKCGDNISIEISDDGTGIPEERMREIKESRVEHSGRGHTTGIGLNNVHKRLQHFFGLTCNFEINSREGEGTSVTLTVPYVK